MDLEHNRPPAYDLIVLGGGSAGSAAAATAVQGGMKRVLVVNEGELGGLCILRGCMPTKTLLATSDLLHDLRDAQKLAIHVGAPAVDFAALMERKRQLVARFQRAKVAAMEGGGYEIRFARASFAGQDRIRVDGEELSARYFLIATGSRLRVPAIPGLDQIPYLHSDALMELAEPPRSLIVHGAGAVGLEFATFFAGLGCEVHLLHRSPLLNNGEDPRLSAQMAKAMQHLGVKLHGPAEVNRLEPSAVGVRAVIQDGSGERTLEAERYLLALGREANLEGLGLDLAQVTHTGSKLHLDETLATSNPRVFAAGDATDERQILHTGNMEARHVARNLLRLDRGEAPLPWREEIPLFAIFTHPPYAQVGLLESEARAKGLDVVVASKEFGSQGRGIVMGAVPGAASAKLIAERGTGRLLGAQFLGPRADDLIHVAATVLHFRGGARDLVQMPWYHPTLSEVYIELARPLLG